MKLRADQLPRHVSEPLRPVYVVFGDEILLHLFHLFKLYLVGGNGYGTYYLAVFFLYYGRGFFYGVGQIGRPGLFNLFGDISLVLGFYLLGERDHLVLYL